MNKVPTDRAAVPEAKGRGPSTSFVLSLLLASLVILSLAWIPVLEASANAYRAHTEEMIKNRRCEDTTKPVTRRAVR